MKSFSIVFKTSRKLLLALTSLMFTGCIKTPEEPKLSVSTDTLFFKGNEAQSIYITTNNPERRQLYIDYPYWWIGTNLSNPNIVEGDTVELKVNSYLNNYTTPQKGSIYIGCAYDEKTVVLIGLPECCNPHFVPDTLFFPLGTDSVTMTIGNYGDTPMDYAITASSNEVSFSPASGQVPKLQHADITVAINRENLFVEPNPKLFVTIGDNVHTVLIVPERKQLLPNEVVDAEYARATDLLVYVSSDSKLNIYHPDTKTLSSVELSYVPLCVSVSPDGTKAVVGHNSYVTYVDLMAGAVLTENEVAGNGSDIVLTDSGWAYIFPTYSQSPYIRCIDVTINNSLITLSTSGLVSSDIKAKLHPSGKYIYGVDNGSSSSDMEKFDIQEGTARFLYETPTYTFELGGDLWFEENGVRAFTRAGTVLKTSEVHSQDMISDGQITLEGSSNARIKWLEHLALRNEFYLVLQGDYDWYQWDYEPNPPYVYVYRSDDLGYKTKIKTEDYIMFIEGSWASFAASPHFVFAHSNGNELYVITKADGSGMVREWAIQTIDLE